jgi:hypothetical protein
MSLNQGVVQTVIPTAISGGLNPIQGMNPQTDAWVSEIHGKFYTAARSGKLWMMAPLIAGVTIPVNTTTSPTFTLFNPIASGVNLELVTFDWGFITTGTWVAAGILGSIAKQTPTSTTSGLNVLNPMNAGVPAASSFSAATIGAAITTHIPLLNTPTATSLAPAHVDFDGKVVLPPGWLITITSTPVQTAVSMPMLTWVEWPV